MSAPHLTFLTRNITSLHFEEHLKLAKTDVEGIDFSHEVIVVKAGEVVKSVALSVEWYEGELLLKPVYVFSQGCFHVFLRVLPTRDDELRSLCSLAMRCLSGKNDLLLDLIMEPRLPTRLTDIIQSTHSPKMKFYFPYPSGLATMVLFSFMAGKIRRMRIMFGDALD